MISKSLVAGLSLCLTSRSLPLTTITTPTNYLGNVEFSLSDELCRLIATVIMCSYLIPNY